jgi:hypothetical protein
MAAKIKQPWEVDKTDQDSTEEVAEKATSVEIVADSDTKTELAVSVTVHSEIVADAHEGVSEATDEVLASSLKAVTTKVVAVVPKDFTLTLDNHQRVEYRNGTYPMDRSHALHWWSAMQGVEIYEEPIEVNEDPRLTEMKASFIKQFAAWTEDERETQYCQFKLSEESE